MAATRERSYIGPRQVGVIDVTAEEIRQAGGVDGLGLDSIGVGITRNDIARMATGMDAMVTTPTVGTLLQFAQVILPGTIRTLTRARKVDTLFGIRTVGSWEMESVIQKLLEPVGAAQPYTDHGNLPFASYNPSFEEREIVRFEAGLEVGLLEEARASLMQVNAATEKRNAAMEALEISRNRIGIFGYNGGNNRTYGMLNDPGLPAYVTVPAGASGSTQWMNKTFIEIARDIRLGMASLQTRSGGSIDVRKTPITLAIPVSVEQFLTITNDLGTQTVEEWLNKNYPQLRIEGIPELEGANGGVNAGYLYAESVEGTGDDDGATWQQLVAAKVQPMGVEKRVKVYVEGYTNAVAGVMLTRPFAVYRFSGI